MKKTYFVYVAVCYFAFGSGIFMAGGDFIFFFDPATLFIILVPTIAILLANFSPREVINSFSLAMKKNIGTEAEYQKSVMVFNGMLVYLIISAFIAAFLGIVLMLSIPLSFSKFGKGLAVCLLAVLYTLILMLTIILPFRNALKKKLIKG